MKKENGFWIDENNNRWSMGRYAEADAIECSKSLVRCKECENCGVCEWCEQRNDK